MMVLMERLAPHFVEVRCRPTTNQHGQRTFTACVTVSFMAYGVERREATFSVDGSSPTAALLAALGEAKVWLEDKRIRGEVDEEPRDDLSGGASP